MRSSPRDRIIGKLIAPALSEEIMETISKKPKNYVKRFHKPSCLGQRTRKEENLKTQAIYVILRITFFFN